MFTKILIANRGEIACRVAATARRLGIRTVAVYSDADAGAKHVMACDEAVHIGGNAPRDSYLRSDRILEAARATGAQAVHPRLRLPQRERGLCTGLRRRRPRLHRPAAVGDQGDGPEG
jgi:acetyl/propionyl-CoA carboxylase alpha subunit